MISAIPVSSVSSDPMLRLSEELERLRQSPCTPVLLVGPPGAGKQHTAELLHQMSYEGVEAAPFVTVDCAALPREFLESELFGHERGAFADATSARRGLVELAHGGSLFLHEVTALPLAAQTMLLKFLDGMRLRRLGAQHELELSLRVIATASREPRELVKSRQIPRRPVSSTGCVPRQRACAERAPGRDHGTESIVRRSLQRADEERRQRPHRRGASLAQRLRVSRQHPRASHDHRACRDQRARTAPFR